MELAERQEAELLARLYPLKQCECGTITLGDSEVVIRQGEPVRFPRHECKEEVK
jgi:hypothetical protein